MPVQVLCSIILSCHFMQIGSESDPAQSPAWPVLAALGKAPSWQGPVGTAAGIKLALNHLIAVETVGLIN